MNLIGVSQRVITAGEHQERRDALDQRWAFFIHACGFTPYPIPNHIHLVDNILNLPLKGIVFTGGNSLEDDAPERDAVEIAILKYALRHHLPILGVCRGMQMIMHFFGSSLVRVEGHITPMHQIIYDGLPLQVNSYHEFGAFEVHEPLQVVGRADNGVIEAVRHVKLPIEGIMWHPEGNHPFIEFDKTLMIRLFTKE